MKNIVIWPQNHPSRLAFAFQAGIFAVELRPRKEVAMTIDQMKQRLSDNYPGSAIEVFDLTGGSDHWEVSVESENFAGMSRIQQHQSVMACFGPELKTGEVHALSIKTKIKQQGDFL